MPDLPCPVGDYTARGTTLADAAKKLSQHLISQHCDTPTEDSSDPSFLPDDLDLGMKDLDADISAKGRIDVDAADVQADVEARGQF